MGMMLRRYHVNDPVPVVEKQPEIPVKKEEKETTTATKKKAGRPKKK